MPLNSLGRIGLGAASALSTWLGSTAVHALEPLDRSTLDADVCPFASCSGSVRDAADALHDVAQNTGVAAIFRCSGR